MEIKSLQFKKICANDSTGKVFWYRANTPFGTSYLIDTRIWYHIPDKKDKMISVFCPNIKNQKDLKKAIVICQKNFIAKVKKCLIKK